MLLPECKNFSGHEVRFVTGLDEHGQKVQQIADQEGISPQKGCDGIADEFKALLKNLDESRRLHSNHGRAT